MSFSPTLLLRDVGSHLRFAEMQQICAPLLSFNITGFFFMRRYRDGSFIDLATHPIGSQVFFEKLYNEEYTNEDVNCHVFLPEGLSLSALNAKNKIWQDAKHLHKIGNAATVVNENINHTDIYCFFSTSQNYKINQFYLSNIDVLHRFSAYFDEKARDIIIQSEKNKLILPQYYCEADRHIVCQNNDRKHFLQTISNHASQLNLGARYCHAKLSKKEMECLYWLMKHKSIDEIAIILGKSPRTVEKQINSVKSKFSCYKTSELLHMTNVIHLENTLHDILFEK